VCVWVCGVVEGVVVERGGSCEWERGESESKREWEWEWECGECGRECEAFVQEAAVADAGAC
jgi:hypothetical protein